jgi:hypothetical protein
MLELDVHAVLDVHEAPLAIADALYSDQAFEAHSHHAVGRASLTGYWSCAAMIETPGKHGRGDGVAFTRLDARSVDRETHARTCVRLQAPEHGIACC